ncbi:type III effector HrpK domain-containing protein [Alcaligenes faecalis]|uniref:type III effector HrpK domain-containing protein n=1 Tax=Alcaligenes TaxID=507 RepID=UPI0035583069
MSKVSSAVTGSGALEAIVLPNEKNWKEAVDLVRNGADTKNGNKAETDPGKKAEKPNGDANIAESERKEKPEGDKKEKPLSESERIDRAKDYAEQLEKNFDELKGDGKYITLKDLQNYKNDNPDMKKELKEAISFWSQPEAFDLLETAKNPDKLKPDGDLSKNDLKGFLENKDPKALPEKLFKNLDEKLDVEPEGDKYKAYLKEHPDADKEAKQIAKYVDIIDQNYDDIKDAKDDGKYVSRADLLEYAEQNKGIGKEFKEALEFWSDLPAFRILETSKDAKSLVPDGDLSKNDLKGWFEHEAPTTKAEAEDLRERIAEGEKLQPDSKRYREFVEKNPDADETSLKLFKYADILDQNYESIVSGELEGMEKSGKTGGKLPYLTVEKLEAFKKEHPKISDEFKEAIDFWTQPGAFDILERAKNPTRLAADGDLSRNDLKGWMEKQAPKSADEAITFLSSVADANVAAETDTSKFTKDIFENPDKYSAKDKAAVLQELYSAQKLISAGAEAGMYRDDQSQIAISNKAKVHFNPEKVYDDVNKHIAILEGDKDTLKYMSENGNNALKKILDDNEGLKDTVQKSYDEDVKTGKTLDKLWDSKENADKDQQEILAGFYSQARSYQVALGIDNAGEIQKAVKDSKHSGDLEQFYEKKLASGDRLKELLKDNSFEAASSAYSMEVSLYTSALDPSFTEKFDDKLNDSFSEVARDNILKDAGFDDLKQAFGKGNSGELDEKKVEKVIEEVKKENPELFINDDGTVATTDQILAGFRGSWDVVRQGTKALTELSIMDKKNSSLGKATSSGVLHGVSGLFLAGVTIAKGIQAGDKPSERAIVDITTGSVQTATTLIEGGIKGYQTHLNDAKARWEAKGKARVGPPLIETVEPESKSFKDKFKNNMKGFENAAKGLGGAAGAAAGAYQIFDGVKALRAGDELKGGMNLTAGILGGMAGAAGMVEGGLGLLGATIPRAIPVMAGTLGMAAAGMAAVAMFIPGLVDEIKQEGKVDDYGNLLRDYLTKYEIDGVENGDIGDIPDEEWPDGGDTWWST